MLANFAAGAFLPIFRPISVGNFISADGITGTVEEIDMFVTTIRAPDNVHHIVPNGKILSDTIQNFSAQPYRRVELVAQLDKSADVEVLEFSERGPRLAVRPYTHTDHYWQVYFDTNRMIADVLGRNGFPVPRIPVAVGSAFRR